MISNNFKPKKPSFYLVWHTLGLPGTWATWFIDQHRNFSKSDIILSNEIPSNQKDFIPEIVEYPIHCNIPPHSLSWYDTLLPDDVYLNKLNSSDHTGKIAIKLSDFHYLSKIDDDQVTTEELVSSIPLIVRNTIKLNIFLTVDDPSGRTVNHFAERIGDLKQVPIGKGQFGHNNLERLFHILANLSREIKYFPHLEQIAPIYYLSIDKLLEHDREEYENLCFAINEDPLENWEELLEPMDRIFSRY